MRPHGRRRARGIVSVLAAYSPGTGDQIMGRSSPFLRLLFATVVSFAIGCGRSSSGSFVDLEGMAMGTSWHVRLPALPAGRDEEQLAHAIARVLDEVEDQMSTYRPSSELSRFNKLESDEWMPVSAATVEVVKEAQRVHALSLGAFDPTVHPVLALWGFGAAGEEREKLPTEAEIADARARTGFDAIEVRLDPPALRKTRPEVMLDLSAIAKGWGVDQVSDFLRGAGVTSSFVEVGGEVCVRGAHPDGTLWRIGIEVPGETLERTVYAVLPLRDASVATSGDYRNYVEIEGERFSHTIDPRDGRPVGHRLASVSVVAETCAEADALATALMVLGEDEGYTFAEEHDIRALFLVRTDDGFDPRRTEGMPSLEPVSRGKP